MSGLRNGCRGTVIRSQKGIQGPIGPGRFLPLKRYVYLVADTSDATLMGGASGNTYTTAQAAYDAAVALAVSTGLYVDIVVMNTKSSSVGGITLAAAWNTKVNFQAWGNAYIDYIIGISTSTTGYDVSFSCYTGELFITYIDTSSTVAKSGSVTLSGNINITDYLSMIPGTSFQCGTIRCAGLTIFNIIQVNSSTAVGGPIILHECLIRGSITRSTTSTGALGDLILIGNAFSSDTPFSYSKTSTGGWGAFVMQGNTFSGIMGITSFDITGKTSFNFSSDNIYPALLKKDVLLISSNATESISTILNMPEGVPVRFHAAIACNTTFVSCNDTTANGLHLRTNTNVVLGLNTYSWIELTKINGIIYETGLFQ